MGVESDEVDLLTMPDLEKLGEADDDLEAEEHAEPERVAARSSVLDMVTERKVERVIVERGESEVDLIEDGEAVDVNVGRDDIVARDADDVPDRTGEEVDDFDTATDTVKIVVRVGLTVRETEGAAENEMDERTDGDTVTGADRVLDPESDLKEDREFESVTVAEIDREPERVKLSDAVPVAQPETFGVADTERVTAVDRDGLGVNVLRLDCVFVLDAEFVDVEEEDFFVEPERCGVTEGSGVRESDVKPLGV